MSGQYLQKEENNEVLHIVNVSLLSATTQLLFGNPSGIRVRRSFHFVGILIVTSIQIHKLLKCKPFDNL